MSTPKGRILCTEDDADTCELIRLILRADGYEVITTQSSANALELAHSQAFDLYLVDTRLPGMSGPELTAKLREFDTTTPVLFYSGAGYERDKEKAREAGAQGYLVKPVRGEDLILEVTRLIAEAQIAVALDIGPSA
jgi:DNA-binding response OmpR family regulator